MNAITTSNFEELMGQQMAQLARKEGHISRMPEMKTHIAEKCRAERLANNTLREIGERSQRMALEAIQNGHTTVKDIVEATGLHYEAARRACKRLHDAGLVKRTGIVSIAGGQAYTYAVADIGEVSV
jgi:predicted transcriptional regulator